MTIALIAILLAGVANFAIHRWLLESGHPAIQAAVLPMQRVLGANATYFFEFLLLLGALWGAQASPVTALILYGIYTALDVGMVGWVKSGG